MLSHKSANVSRLKFMEFLLFHIEMDLTDSILEADDAN